MGKASRLMRRKQRQRRLKRTLAEADANSNRGCWQIRGEAPVGHGLGERRRIGLRGEAGQHNEGGHSLGALRADRRMDGHAMRRIGGRTKGQCCKGAKAFGRIDSASASNLAPAAAGTAGAASAVAETGLAAAGLD